MSARDQHQKKVPIRMGDFSVMDAEFGNIRERFDSEMRKMEDEMNKFRGELLSKESNVLKNSSSTSHSSSEKKDGAISSGGNLGSGLGSHSNWLSGFNSPLIKDSKDKDNVPEGGKELKLRFDVSAYSPEEIMVKTVDNKLLVAAKHEEKGEGKAVYREYNREFLLPSGTDPETIRSSLSKDGILTVEAPLPQAAITQEK